MEDWKKEYARVNVFSFGFFWPFPQCGGPPNPDFEVLTLGTGDRDVDLVARIS
jgi:hypothetical protein